MILVEVKKIQQNLQLTLGCSILKCEFILFVSMCARAMLHFHNKSTTLRSRKVEKLIFQSQKQEIF